MHFSVNRIIKQKRPAFTGRNCFKSNKENFAFSGSGDLIIPTG